MSTKNTSFETRPASDDIVFTGAADAAATDSIPAGSTVILRCENVEIRVAVTGCGKKKSYQGTVIGFLNHDGQDVAGITIGQELPFDESNIFSCENLAAAA
ncbi:MAG: hypothetical protein ACYTGG_00750 [Planctomycetota bacterium]|jgi:hypothetical protein